jgi:hypothetical protein
MDGFFGVIEEILKTIRISSQTAKRTNRAAALMVLMTISVIVIFVSVALVMRYLWP